jgi:hypothetical protein
MGAAGTALLERALHPDLRVGRGSLGPAVAALDGHVLLLSQPEPYAALDPVVRARADETVMVDSLAADDLDALVAGLPATDQVVGVGGGMTIDAAQHAPRRRGLPHPPRAVDRQRRRCRH